MNKRVHYFMPRVIPDRFQFESVAEISVDVQTLAVERVTECDPPTLAKNVLIDREGACR